MPSRESDAVAFVYLSARWFALCWCTVNLVRMLHIGFLVAMTFLYLWLLRSEDRLQNTLDNLMMVVSYSTLGILIWFFTLVAALQLFMASRSVWNAVKPVKTASIAASVDKSSSIQEPRSGLSFTKLAAVMNTLDSIWTPLFARWIEPFFFIRGEHFDRYSLVREYIEVAVQVYQGYQMSIFAASRRLNNLFILMIFVNCLSTPVIHWLVPDTKVPLRRLLNLCFSALLNFINSVVIPFVLFMPYVGVFDTSLGRFTYKYFMDDVWYAQAVRENGLLFVTSYLDFVTTWIPQWNLFSCLWTFESLVRRGEGKVSNAVVPFESFKKPATGGSTPQQQRDPENDADSENKVLSLLKNTRHHVLWITGVVVTAIHIAAQSPRAISGCRLLSTPWFETKFSCVILNLNCQRREIDGSLEQLHDVLVVLATSSLFQLSISHCPKLQMPGILQTFDQLGALDLYNCTLYQWSCEAALTQQFHPVLDFVWILRTNLSGIPEGMMTIDFPSSVNVVAFHEVNLTSLPDRLDQSWSSLRTFQCELCPMTTYPSVLTRMGTPLISLAGTRISTIDATDLFLNGSLRALWMANSSLQNLPHEYTGPLTKLTYLTLQFSQLAKVPPYLMDWEKHCFDAHAWYVMSLFGTPYCTTALLSLPRDAQQDTDEQAFQRRVCVYKPQFVFAMDPDFIGAQRMG